MLTIKILSKTYFLLFLQKLEIAHQQQINSTWITSDNNVLSVQREGTYEWRPLSTIDVYSDSLTVSQDQNRAESTSNTVSKTPLMYLIQVGIYILCVKPKICIKETER